jgi:hypothetical protein
MPDLQVLAFNWKEIIMKKKPQSRQFPNPPKAEEIEKAREIMIKRFGSSTVAEDRQAMQHWYGVGWHKDEIYFGILIGLQIAKTRRDKADDYRDWDYQDQLATEREEEGS